MPLHPEPFNQLVATFDLEDQAYFRPLGSESDIHKIVFDEGRPEVEPVGLLVSSRSIDDKPYVVGLVVKNPVWHQGDYANRKVIEQEWPEALTSSELLVCDLRSWHEVGFEVDGYNLWWVEFIHTAQTVVICPVVQWRRAEVDEDKITLSFDETFQEVIEQPLSYEPPDQINRAVEEGD